MQAPGKPANETTRLHTLHSLAVLDTAPEERFDRITRVARRLFAVPIALVSLVDAERQWFKSATGLDASQTPRDISFCSHAILQDEIFLIPDASQDVRFSDNPLVTGAPYIRFYAGCPLKGPDGSKVGTLCIIDREPRQLDAEEQDLLRDLADIVEQELAAVHQANVDELTRISNRRGFEALAQQALGLCKRLDKPASLYFFDLDGFKEINDRFGHTEGDHALGAFAQALKAVFRDSDVIGRLGGDEFTAFLPDTEQVESAMALERLSQAVSELNLASRRGYALRYSVGATVFDHQRHRALADMMIDADIDMYAHKQRRRTNDTIALSLAA